MPLHSQRCCFSCGCCNSSRGFDLYWHWRRLASHAAASPRYPCISQSYRDRSVTSLYQPSSRSCRRQSGFCQLDFGANVGSTWVTSQVFSAHHCNWHLVGLRTQSTYSTLEYSNASKTKSCASDMKHTGWKRPAPREISPFYLYLRSQIPSSDFVVRCKWQWDQSKSRLRNPHGAT